MKKTIVLDPVLIAGILSKVGGPLIVITEYIKNCYDAGPSEIQIKYDRAQKIISFHDDGDGFSAKAIENLENIGDSLKKKDGECKTTTQHYFAGSMGLGILSAFSICDRIEMISVNELGERYSLFWDRGEPSFSLTSELVVNTSSFTEFTLKNISDPTFSLLESETELTRLKHITNYLYLSDQQNFPRIYLEISGVGSSQYLFATEFAARDFDSVFSFDKDRKVLKFQCVSDKHEICEDEIEISDFSVSNLKAVLHDVYKIQAPILTIANDEKANSALFDIMQIPNFEGRILTFNRNSSGGLAPYGHGVNIYVNNFAVYNYLKQEYDWLELSHFSQRKKATTFKLHTTYGYVNLPEFDENKEKLEIAPDRADFIQNYVYEDFMYLLKGVVGLLMINIDVENKRKKHHQDPIPSPEPEPMGDPSLNERESENEDFNLDEFDPAELSDLHELSDEDLAGSVHDQKKVRWKEIKSPFGFNESELVKIKEDCPIDVDEYLTKIRLLSYELSNTSANFQYSQVACFRMILEAATYLHLKKAQDFVAIAPNQLPGLIVKTLNDFRQETNKNSGLTNKKEVMAKITAWERIIKDKKLVEQLNLYIHNSATIDYEFVVQSWIQMKDFIFRCIEEYSN